MQRISESGVRGVWDVGSQTNLTRRRFLATVAAASLISGCENHPVVQFLGAMQRWNEKAEGLIFSPRRLAPELPASATTPEDAFPPYFVSDSIPLTPPGWTLRVGGLVKRPTVLTLTQLSAMPRTDMRVRHHC